MLVKEVVKEVVLKCSSVQYHYRQPSGKREKFPQKKAGRPGLYCVICTHRHRKRCDGRIGGRRCQGYKVFYNGRTFQNGGEVHLVVSPRKFQTHFYCGRS